MRTFHPRGRAPFGAAALSVAGLMAAGALAALSPAAAAPPVTINATLAVSNPSSVGSAIYQGTGTVRIRGTLSPGDSNRDGVGDTVKVWGSRNGGAWKQVGTSTADPESGTYASITTVPGSVGTWKYAVTNGAPPSTATASMILPNTVSVRASHIRVAGFGSKCKRTRRVPITGYVRPAVAGRTVRVQRRLGGTSKWVNINTKTTSSTGRWKTSTRAWRRTKRKIFVRAWLWEPATGKWVVSPVKSFKRCN